MRNWTLKAYTNDVFANLAQAPAKIKSIIIANTTAGAINASLRISNGPSEERAIILPATEIPAGESKIMDLCELSLGRGDILQATGSATGLHFTASGDDK